MKRITRLGAVATSSGAIPSPSQKAGARPIGHEASAYEAGGDLLAAGMATAGDALPQLAGGALVAPVDALNVPLEYPHRINTYAQPPTYDISIEQFEGYALARLQLLRAVENACMRFQREDEIAKAVKAAEEKYMPLHGNKSAHSYSLFEERRRDHASHYILRLAYCTTAENIRWFTTHELALLRFRFANDLASDRADFLASCPIAFEPISDGERAALADRLQQPFAATSAASGEEYVRVPFELVPDLVTKRAVYLQGGWAYLARADSFSVIMTHFRDALTIWMERTARELPLLRDERLLPLLALVKSADASDATEGDAAARGFVHGSKLTASDIIPAAAEHFPPCMQRLVSAGLADGHLKYGGRQQLGLFLKGIGLPLDEAILFWRKLFGAKTTPEAFNKNYLYNVRHNYGQEGKRANYGPGSCAKIITGSAGSGEHHGCPFKQLPSERLAAMLATSYKVPHGCTPLDASQIDQVVHLAAGNHCQSACTRLFELTRASVPGQQVETFIYPSKFFEASTNRSKGSAAPPPSSSTPKRGGGGGGAL